MDTAVLDACVLFRGGARDFFLWVAEAGAFSPGWSDTIHEEWMRSRRDKLDDRGRAPCLIVAYRLQSGLMIEVRQTDEFRAWLRRLKDDNAVARIVARIRRIEQGNLGDTKSVGAGLMEMRIDYAQAIASTMCSAGQRL